MRGIPHNQLTYGQAEVDAVAEVVRSGYWACGPKAQELEAALAGRAGVKWAVCVASGSAALRLGLRGLEIQAGDRVLVPAYCCVALANAVLACGANPVPVDISPLDWNIDPMAVTAAVSDHSPKAIIAVHTFGSPANIRGIRELGVPVIEDCAHAFGLRIKGEFLGGSGEVAILSFYATKLMGAGEGGVVLTNSPGVAGFVREWRDYTDQPLAHSRLNDKMTDLEAALALCQLNRLDEMLAARRHRADRYHELLAEGAAKPDWFQLPRRNPNRVWYRYDVEMKKLPAWAIVKRLALHGVRAAQPIADWRPRGVSVSPMADRAYRSIVSLPLFPSLTEEEQDSVARAFMETCSELA